jgi:hypothetical protein
MFDIPKLIYSSSEDVVICYQILLSNRAALFVSAILFALFSTVQGLRFDELPVPVFLRSESKKLVKDGPIQQNVHSRTTFSNVIGLVVAPSKSYGPTFKYVMSDLVDQNNLLFPASDSRHQQHS